MITCKSTAELFKAIRQTLEAGNTPVIQTNVPEIVFEVLKTLKGYQRYCPVWNEKATLAQGFRMLRMSVEFPDSDIIPVFLAKHRVGQLSKPFVRIVLLQAGWTGLGACQREESRLFHIGYRSKN